MKLLIIALLLWPGLEYRESTSDAEYKRILRAIEDTRPARKVQHDREFWQLLKRTRYNAS